MALMGNAWCLPVLDLIRKHAFYRVAESWSVGPAPPQKSHATSGMAQPLQRADTMLCLLCHKSSVLFMQPMRLSPTRTHR